MQMLLRDAMLIFECFARSFSARCVAKAKKFKWWSWAEEHEWPFFITSLYFLCELFVFRFKMFKILEVKKQVKSSFFFLLLVSSQKSFQFSSSWLSQKSFKCVALEFFFTKKMTAEDDENEIEFNRAPIFRLNWFLRIRKLNVDGKVSQPLNKIAFFCVWWWLKNNNRWFSLREISNET